MFAMYDQSKEYIKDTFGLSSEIIEGIKSIDFPFIISRAFNTLSDLSKGRQIKIVKKD